MASFALRFAESLPEVEIVLSGMNTMAQLLDNLKERKPLIPEEQARLMQAARLISRSTAIPCTGCGYCLKSCPKQICIPDYFKLYNEYFRSPDEDWKVAPVYQELTRDHSRAGDCITCRSCEQRCPQKLPVSDYLRRVSKHFDH